MNLDFQPLWLTFKLAIITTAILLIIGTLIAGFLAHRSFRLKAVIEAMISLPLVLPPSVLGFYLLIAFSPESVFGKLLQSIFNIRLIFSFPGLVIGSLIYSLPFMVHPIQAGLQGLPSSLKEAAFTLGKSNMKTLTSVLLPNIKPAMLTGIVLTFAHTVGEFGVVLMIGGNLEGKTRVASIAVFDEVEAMNYHAANIYSLLLISFSFCILLMVYLLNRRILKSN